MTAAIAFHHYPDFDVVHREFIRVVCAADLMAHLAELKELEPGLVASLKEEGKIPVELSHAEVEEIFHGLMAEISESQAYLSI